MKPRPQLRDLTVDAFMKTRPLTLTPAQSASEAIESLVRHDVSGAPVLDEGRRVIGFLSAKDCMLAVRGALYFGIPPSFVVGDLMTSPAETIMSGASLVEAAEKFSTRPYRRLPVVDDKRRLVGVIRRHHILAAYLEHFEAHQPTIRGNARLAN